MGGQVVDNLDSQPDLIELSKRVLEGAEGSQSPQTYTIIVTVLEVRTFWFIIL